MWKGDGFGVGLTVSPREPDPAGKAAELSRVQRLKAQPAAYEAAVIMSFAADRPDADDVPAGAPGAASPDWAAVDDVPAGACEFFVDELAAALGTSVTSASHSWTLTSTLHDRLPGTWRAMADGELDLPRGRAIAAEVARAPSPEPLVHLAVETAVLPVARELTVTRLRARVRAELVAHDALFAERCRRAAERRADTVVRPDPEAPGSASTCRPRRPTPAGRSPTASAAPPRPPVIRGRSVCCVARRCGSGSSATTPIPTVRR